MTCSNRRKISSLVVMGLIGMMSAACRRDVAPINRIYYNPYPRQQSMVVTPFLNQSGCENLDPMAVTDEFYAELQQVEGLQVVPVNRVLAALAQLGLAKVSSPAEALALAKALDADSVMVGSITQYDPYPPPKVGMAVQLYARDRQDNQQTEALHVNPGEMARAAKNLELSIGQYMQPRAAVVRILDADRDEVIKRIKQYAEKRSGRKSPTGWQTYTTSRNYLRFVAHEIIGELLAQERFRLNTPERQDQ